MPLPPSSAVNVGVFSGLSPTPQTLTSLSYKYLFFLSLLDALEKKYRLELPATQQVGLRVLAVGMFVHAWYPRVYFRLSFGAQDQVATRMAMPSKGSRRIKVGKAEYRWIASGNSGWIDLYVEHALKPGTMLYLTFDFEQTLVPKTLQADIRCLGAASQGTKITPRVVRAAVEAALEEGWNAEARQPREFRLSQEALKAVIEVAGRSEQSDEEKQRLFRWLSGVDDDRTEKAEG